MKQRPPFEGHLRHTPCATWRAGGRIKVLGDALIGLGDGAANVARHGGAGSLPLPRLSACPPQPAPRCFPSASPTMARRPGKQKAAPKDRSKPLIFLRKPGAGEGIRTLDPNLGNGLQGYAPGYPGVRQTTINCVFSVH
jgi:hypothetical protein